MEIKISKNLIITEKEIYDFNIELMSHKNVDVIYKQLNDWNVKGVLGIYEMTLFYLQSVHTHNNEIERISSRFFYNLMYYSEKGKNECELFEKLINSEDLEKFMLDLKFGVL